MKKGLGERKNGEEPTSSISKSTHLTVKKIKIKLYQVTRVVSCPFMLEMVFVGSCQVKLSQKHELFLCNCPLNLLYRICQVLPIIFTNYLKCQEFAIKLYLSWSKSIQNLLKVMHFWQILHWIWSKCENWIVEVWFSFHSYSYRDKVKINYRRVYYKPLFLIFKFCFTICAHKGFNCCKYFTVWWQIGPTVMQREASALVGELLFWWQQVGLTLIPSMRT